MLRPAFLPPLACTLAGAHVASPHMRVVASTCAAGDGSSDQTRFVVCGVEQVRKKNLQPASEHQVRVRAKTGETWGDFSEPVSWSTLASDAKRIAEAPSVTGAREAVRARAGGAANKST